jgi:hypothetical protein
MSVQYPSAIMPNILALKTETHRGLQRFGLAACRASTLQITISAGRSCHSMRHGDATAATEMEFNSPNLEETVGLDPRTKVRTLNTR